MRRWALPIVLVVACGTPAGATDAGLDAARVADTGTVADTATADATAVDAPVLDAPALDADRADVAAVDAAPVDDASVPPPGIPFGPFALMTGPTGWAYGPAPFTLTLNYEQPSTIVAELDRAHAAGVHLVLAMTGGPHSLYITAGHFDRALWNARMDAFDTPAIRTAIMDHVADGTILAASVMDEPDHVSWGGVVTPAEIESMSAYVKAIFPMLPTATVVQLDWYPTATYASLDFLIRQFSYDLVPAQGPNEPNAYRDAVIAQASAQGVGVFFSMNVLDGGARVAGCPVPATGGPGTYGPNCRMTPDEVERAGLALTTGRACGLLMWQSDATYFGDAAQVAAFGRVATALASRTPDCHVP